MHVLLKLKHCFGSDRVSANAVSLSRGVSDFDDFVPSQPKAERHSSKEKKDLNGINQ